MNIIMKSLPPVPGMFGLVFQAVFYRARELHDLHSTDNDLLSVRPKGCIWLTLALCSFMVRPCKSSSSSESKVVPVLKRGPCVLVGFEMSCLEMR